MAQNYDIKGFEYQVHRLVPCSLHAVMQKKIEFEFMYVCALARTLLYKKAYWPYKSHYKMMTISELFLISLIQLIRKLTWAQYDWDLIEDLWSIPISIA